MRGDTLAYQARKNVWLSPRLSTETMDVSALVAFGAAVVGHALAGPVGAFIALPESALATGMVREYGRPYDAVRVPESADLHDPVRLRVRVEPTRGAPHGTCETSNAFDRRRQRVRA